MVILLTHLHSIMKIIGINMKDQTREKLTKILDDNIDYGYEWQMSDYAVSEAEEKQYEKKGREQINKAVDQLQALIQEQKQEMLEEIIKELDGLCDPDEGHMINHGEIKDYLNSLKEEGVK